MKDLRCLVGRHDFEETEPVLTRPLTIVEVRDHCRRAGCTKVRVISFARFWRVKH